MLKENKEILAKLQNDMTKQKTILLDRIKQETPGIVQGNVEKDKVVEGIMLNFVI